MNLEEQLASLKPGQRTTIDGAEYYHVPHVEVCADHVWEDVAPEGSNQCAACSKCGVGRFLKKGEQVVSGKIVTLN
jgi:hypothetical protein